MMLAEVLQVQLARGVAQSPSISSEAMPASERASAHTGVAAVAGRTVASRHRHARDTTGAVVCARLMRRTDGCG